ncbi:Activator of stress 1 [Hyphodiscus hymeniophilus]|uniref:Activator of stress 1 n=1 Tax=Hyphodiscus hymeniophilus TaxID=353542 RepID=A0A9P6VFR4_9HELO|nr:Activator of stress 1 [Hyphodiscus hymeniophilus]
MSGSFLTQGSMSIAMPSSASPGQSSPESFEVEEDHNAMSSAPWQQGQGQTSPTSASQPRTSVPLQKRRRVTRACDECRRKKIKCDGKQPCTHCTVYSYDCTYDQPSNRRRNPAPQYIEALETRLHRAEALLKSVLPNVDLNDPNLDAVILQKRELSHSAPPSSSSDAPPNNSEQDAQLRSMITSTGTLDLDESGHWDFHGNSSGTVFVQRMREQFGGILGGQKSTPMLPRIPRPTPMPPTFDSPRSSVESPMEFGLPNTMELPSKEAAMILCENSLNCACCLLRFVHQPTFFGMVHRIYDVSAENFGDEENRFLPLLYVVLALGCMFHSDLADGPIGSSGNTYKSKIDQGYKYFRAARYMMDITDCRDITSLQAILFMILFLQASANLSTCYSYIGIALRSSLRMGFHRNLAGNFNPIERETRRRVFWVIRKMDTYVSALLGFPQMLSKDDIDQELPVEIDDEYITKDSISPMPPGTTSLYAASNAHTHLLEILTKVIKYIYPTKGLEQSVKGTANSSYVISHAKIREIERDLANWLDKLPMALRPGAEEPPEVLRVQQLLRLAYAHVQMLLYRPFLHYVSQKSCAGKTVDERSYACAAAGVSVSRNVVHICSEMKRRGLLIGAYWFTMYTTFFAVLSLVYFVLENPDKAGSQEILADASAGKEALAGLAKRSQAADRCSVALRGLFEQLPENLKNGRAAPVSAKKKRSAPFANPAGPRGVRSTPDLSQPEPAGGITRATTFPTPTPIQTNNTSKSPFNERLQLNNLSNPNLRQTFQELMSPSDLSATGTLDSSSTSNSNQQYNMQQFGPNTALPDLSAMMFPSADPFAYPNQPMIEFDNIKQENTGNLPQPNYMSNASGMYDDLEGQLFGPIPPYLMQGQPSFEVSAQLDGGMSGLPPHEMNYGTGIAPSGEMNFDGIFSGEGDDWSSFTDQRFRQ